MSRQKERKCRAVRKKVTTRPRVAAALEAAGISCKQIPNVFDRRRHAWEYQETPEARRVIDAALAEIEAEKAGAAE